MKEAQVKTLIKRALDQLSEDGEDIYWFMPPANGYGRAGIPDFVFCVGGIFCAIEAKGEGGKTTALQEREMRSIITSGGIAETITHNDDIFGAVHRIVTTARYRAKHGVLK